MATYIIFLYILGGITGWIIFYYVVKAAVKNGIRESIMDDEVRTIFHRGKPEKPANTEQLKLQQRYEKGEMKLEEYQKEWNRLNS